MSFINASIYRLPYNFQFGEGPDEAFAAINIANADFEKTGLAAGAFYYDAGSGLVLQCVRTRDALAIGNPVQSFVGNAGYTGTFSAYTAPTATSTDNFTAGDLVGAYCAIDSGTGLNQVRRIMSHGSGANSTVTFAKRDSTNPVSTAANSPDNFTTALDGTSVYDIFCPWEVALTTAVTDNVRGVALGTVSDNNWTLVAVKGLVQVNCAGDVTALAAGQDIMPSAAASGLAKGPTANESHKAFGYALKAYAGAAALRLCVIDCIKNAPTCNNHPPRI